VDIEFLTSLILGAWYPYYIPSFGEVSPEEKDWKYENFLVKFIGCWGEGCTQRLPEIIDAHGRLCGLVEKGLRMAGGDGGGGEQERKQNHDEWVLMPLFRRIMIVVDKSEWWVEAVLLVAVQQAERGRAEEEEKKERSGLKTGGSGVINLEFLEKEEHMEKIGEGVYRVKIDRAIEVVMELQASEDETNGQARLQEVGNEVENANIGVDV